MAHDPTRDLTTRALFCRFVGTTGSEKYEHADALRYFREVLTPRERYEFCSMLVDNMHRIEDSRAAQTFLRANVAASASLGAVR